MRIFQILNGFCHWDCSEAVQSLEDARERFAEDMDFVEAPDFVREGWGFDPSAEGDARFIKPTPPVGYLYDDETGTFYKSGDYKPSELDKSPEELARMALDSRKSSGSLAEQITEIQNALASVYELIMGGGKK